MFSFFDREMFEIVVSALANFVLYAAFLNTLFMILYLSFKMRGISKCALWMMEAGAFLLVQTLFAGTVALCRDGILFAIIVILNILLVIRLFKAIDL